MRKVILAYLGGLDTSVIVHWLKENMRLEVICLAADVGQGKAIKSLKERALKCGAGKIYIEDLKEEFAGDFIMPTLQAGAVYEGEYYLSAALSRPLISKHLVKVARKEKADFVAHGCTGKGNDQVRFEVSLASLAPELKVIAPVREWEFKSREEEIDYALRHKLPISTTKKSPYSLDKNLWGVSIECGVLEDPWREPPKDIYQLTSSARPKKEEYLEIGFQKGVPVSVNGRRLNLVKLIEELNHRAGRHGIGRTDLVENRLVGIKSREIYEAPAAFLLHQAHRALESLTLEREVLHFKQGISLRYAELIYYGLWYSPLREALDKFVAETQKNVSGVVKIKMHKGKSAVTGRKSPYSLYNYELATYDKADVFDQSLAKGFIELWGLPLKVHSMCHCKPEAKQSRKRKRI
jgi:argininosuccinate synthase